MTRTRSYTDKTFIVADPDARIRKSGNLLEFETYGPGDPLPAGEKIGNIKRIPRKERVKVDKIKLVPTGSSGSIVFGHVWSPDGAVEYGWTSTRNLDGKFINETFGEVPPAPGSGRFSPNAAWKGGTYIGQRTLVEIMDARLEIERIALDTLDAYVELVEAAARDGVPVALNSGFRSYAEQKYLYEGFVKKRRGFNKAAKPGRSNHQNGIAFDIAVAGVTGNPVYDWLKRNAPARGFIRTVNGEPWHWEYDKAKAAAAVAAHTFKTSNVVS
jgi:hypothetical protein